MPHSSTSRKPSTQRRCSSRPVLPEYACRLSGLTIRAAAIAPGARSAGSTPSSVTSATANPPPAAANDPRSAASRRRRAPRHRRGAPVAVPHRQPERLGADPREERRDQRERDQPSSAGAARRRERAGGAPGGAAGRRPARRACRVRRPVGRPGRRVAPRSARAAARCDPGQLDVERRPGPSGRRRSSGTVGRLRWGSGRTMTSSGPGTGGSGSSELGGRVRRRLAAMRSRADASSSGPAASGCLRMTAAAACRRLAETAPGLTAVPRAPAGDLGESPPPVPGRPRRATRRGPGRNDHGLPSVLGVSPGCGAFPVTGPLSIAAAR